MKRFAAIGLGTLALAILGLLVVPSFVNWDGYKSKAVEAVKSATGYDLRIDGPVSLALLPSPSLKIGALSAAPPGMGDAVVALDGATVKVQLWPLFKGKAVVDSIILDAPRFSLLVLADGRQAWMTPELQSLMQGQAQSASSSSGFSESLVLDSVRIEKGSFLYKNLRDGVERSFSDIDAVLRAESLSGPYAAQGAVSFRDSPLVFNLTAGRKESGSYPLNLTVDHDGYGAKIKFSGLLGVEPEMLLQGALGMEVADPAHLIEKTSGTRPGAPALSDPIDLKGMLTASARQAVLKDVELSLGGTSFKGSAEIQSLDKTPGLTATLAALGPVNLDRFLPPSSDAPSQTDKRGFLPRSLMFPHNLPAGTLAFSAPEIVWNKNSLRDVAATASLGPEAVTASFKIADIPGKASAEGQIKLTVQTSEKTAGTGTPVLDGTVKARSQYLPDTLKLAGKDFAGYADLFKTADVESKITITPNRIVFDDTRATLDQTALSGTASYLWGQGTARDAVSLALNAERIDLDNLLARIAKNGPPQQSAAKPAPSLRDRLRSIQSFSLPFNAAFDIKAASLRYGAKDMKDLVLIGKLQDGAVALDTFRVQDFLGADLGARGTIGNLAKLEAVDLKLSGTARDVEALLTNLQMDPSALPRPFGGANLEATLKGNASALNFAVDVDALKGLAQASGVLTGLPDSPAADALDVNLKHPSFADLLRLLRPDTPRDPALSGPLQARAKVLRSQDSYTVQDLAATLGSTTVSGNLAIRTAGARPSISGSLQTGTIPLDAWVGKSQAKTAPASGVRWSRNVIDTRWMRAADLDLKIAANGLRYGGWDLSRPAFSLALKDGVLNIPSFDAGLFNGKVTLAATVAAPQDPRNPLSLQGKANVANVALAPMIRAFTGAVPLDAEGNVSLTLDAKASGVSAAALIFDLSGGGNLTGRTVALKGFDLSRFGNAVSEETKPGDTLTGLWKSATRGGETRFDTVDGIYSIQEGIVRIEKLAFDGPQAQIDTTGTIDLPDWRLNLKNLITLRQAAKAGREPPPPFEIGIAGPLDNPAQTFGQGLLEDYFQRKINRKIEGVIQDKLGKKLPPALQGILGRPAGDAAPAPSPAPEQEQPAAGDEPAESAPASPPKNRQPRPEDVFQGILNNLAR